MTRARPSYAVCKEVSPTCPVEATTLGYYPNKGINAFFAAAFGIAMIVCFAVGVKKRTWSYMAFITAGCALEMAGYASRVPLGDNPWNSSAFQTQIVAIILGPTLICISIYLTLKHVCLSLNPALSRIRPSLYPWIFVPGDVSCLLVQAAGGGIAASAGGSSEHPNAKLLQNGNRAIIAGIVLQVVVLAFFGLSGLDYYIRVRRWIKSPEATPEAVALWNNRRFRLFCYGVTGAYTMILIRCIYRVIEMAGGWGNHIMQDEVSFIVLEGAMVAIAVNLLAFLPPGILFPQMRENTLKRDSAKKEAKRAKKAEKARRKGDNSQQDLEMSEPSVEENKR
ncbi:RTA1 like protein-domain-containing protein [Coniochaeta sp. 2T2.1]|nr:RTA1 like protein-domain-containing protein [Coniochaeta sp. 2T2.1]